jgi:hypothetical protein
MIFDFGCKLTGLKEYPNSWLFLGVSKGDQHGEESEENFPLVWLGTI